MVTTNRLSRSASAAAQAADDANPEPRCVVRYGGARLELADGDTIVGRGDDAGLVIDSPGVSRRHAMISVRGARVTIEDLGSHNGTFVGEERIDSPFEITESVSIRVGPVWFMLQRSEEQR